MADLYFNDLIHIYKNNKNNCVCKKEWLIHEVDLNSFPYGDNYEFDRCSKCGKIHNVKLIKLNK